eukprot:gene6244-12644_t
MDFQILSERMSFQISKIPQFLFQTIPYGPLVLGVFICFLPIIYDWPFFTGTVIDYPFINSAELRVALISSVAISVPLISDLAMDLYQSWSLKEKPKQGTLPYGLLIISLIFPDSIILNYAIPMKSPALIVCLFYFRAILITNSIIRLIGVVISIKVIGNRVLRRERIQLRNTIHDVRDACTQSVTILNELLNFEKIEAGVLKLERTLLCAGQIFFTCLKPLYVEARKADVLLLAPTTNSQTADTLNKAMIYVDQERIIEVLQCLLFIAVSRSPKGKSVSITANIVQDSIVNPYHYSTIPQSVLRLCITDSGFGLSEDMLSTYFKYMFTDKRTHGLSLEAIRGIIDIHSGGMTVHSGDVECGCSITIDLPAKYNNTSLSNVSTTTAMSVMPRRLRTMNGMSSMSSGCDGCDSARLRKYSNTSSDAIGNGIGSGIGNGSSAVCLDKNVRKVRDESIGTGAGWGSATGTGTGLGRCGSVSVSLSPLRKTFDIITAATKRGFDRDNDRDNYCVDTTAAAAATTAAATLLLMSPSPSSPSPLAERTTRERLSLSVSYPLEEKDSNTTRISTTTMMTTTPVIPFNSNIDSSKTHSSYNDNDAIVTTLTTDMTSSSTSFRRNVNVRRVLIVDDSPISRKMLGRVLTSSSSTSASSGSGTNDSGTATGISATTTATATATYDIVITEAVDGLDAIMKYENAKSRFQRISSRKNKT